MAMQGARLRETEQLVSRDWDVSGILSQNQAGEQMDTCRSRSPAGSAAARTAHLTMSLLCKTSLILLSQHS